MTFATVRGGGVRGACSGLARRPAVELPTAPAVAPTSYMVPILATAGAGDNSRPRAPRDRNPRDVDKLRGECYNGCESNAVNCARRSCGGDGWIGRQPILCKAVFGLDESDPLTSYGPLASATIELLLTRIATSTTSVVPALGVTTSVPWWRPLVSV